MNDTMTVSPSPTNSSVPAFVLMLQYLLHQQQNNTQKKCGKYIENIAILHEERNHLEKEREKLQSLITLLQEKYASLEKRMQIMEHPNRLDKLLKFEQLRYSNGTPIETSPSKPETNVYDDMGSLHTFFEAFFKKENAECTKDRALQLAVRTNDTMVTAALVKAGTNIDTEDAMSWQRTPLHWAAVLNYTEIAHILIKAGANVESRETGVYSLYTPLHEAAKHGRLVMCNILLDAQADPDSRDGDRSTPLHIAARNGRLAVVKLLVRRGATVNAVDKWGLTPKDRARRYRHDEVLEWLMQAEKISVV